MDKKLTLSLNQDIIREAKVYAKENNVSLSKLIENYLAALTRKRSKKIKITSLVKSLSGVVELPKDFDEKEAYKDYIIQKFK